jgi:hypothetical protein
MNCSAGCKEAWAWVTNDPQVTGYEYAWRNCQEQSFKALKSGGWGESYVGSPSLTRRWLLLALVYGWMMLLRSQTFHADEQARPVKAAHGQTQRRSSIFREGRCFQNLDRQVVTPRLDFRCYALAPPL